MTDGEDRERGGLDTDDGRRSLMEALGPVAAALGGSLVDEEELDAADIPLRWHGQPGRRPARAGRAAQRRRR